ncbi:MAG: hypothetical protein EOL97_00455 [Spirochaetia bacterium]|nr:hypothetical protein [Spirochaetia bacterium]
MDELYQQISDDTYNSILTTLETRYNELQLSLTEIKEELDSLYKYEGLAWTGRGDYKQAEIEGTIFAYEVFISRHESKQ